MLGGDVVGPYKIAVALELAVRTGEATAPWLWNALPAGRTGGGGTALVHHPNDDAGAFGLVS
jgi:hypothetical protein